MSALWEQCNSTNSENGKPDQSVMHRYFPLKVFYMVTYRERARLPWIVLSAPTLALQLWMTRTSKVFFPRDPDCPTGECALLLIESLLACSHSDQGPSASRKASSQWAARRYLPALPCGRHVTSWHHKSLSSRSQFIHKARWRWAPPKKTWGNHRHSEWPPRPPACRGGIRSQAACEASRGLLSSSTAAVQIHRKPKAVFTNCYITGSPEGAVKQDNYAFRSI